MKNSVVALRVATLALIGTAVPAVAAPDHEMTIEEMEQALGLGKIDAKDELRFRAPSFEVDAPTIPSGPPVSTTPNAKASSAGKGAAAPAGRFSLPVEFDFGSSRITPTYWPTIGRIADLMKQHGGLSLTIRGHTDSVGSNEANEALSKARAESVGAALQSLGIAGVRLRIEGVGERDPINGIADDDAKNRRVEFIRAQ